MLIIVGDNSSTNLGDPILTKCTKYIYEKIAEKNEKVILFDIAGRVKSSDISKIENETIIRDTDISQKKINKKRKKIRSVRKLFFEVNVKALIKWFFFDYKRFNIRLKKVINERKINERLVFCIAGGALLSRSLFYALRIFAIIKFAEKNNASVIFQAIGIENSVYKSWTFSIVKRYLKSDVIKGFSTRDILDERIVKSLKTYLISQIPDSGLWVSDVYNIRKSESNIIGLGVISLEAYKSISIEKKRARNITNESLIDFWITIVNEFDNLNIPWKCFTNGGIKDYNIAREFLFKYGDKSLAHLESRPMSDVELIKQISKYRAVVAHRLHACIISSGLNIPTVPIEWSDKVISFGRMMNIRTYWPVTSNVKSIIHDAVFLESIDNIEKYKEESIFFSQKCLDIC